MNQRFQLLEPILQSCEQCQQPEKHRDGHILVIIAARTKIKQNLSLEPCFPLYGCYGEFEYGYTVQRVGEMA